MFMDEWMLVLNWNNQAGYILIILFVWLIEIVIFLYKFDHIYRVVFWSLCAPMANIIIVFILPVLIQFSALFLAMILIAIFAKEQLIDRFIKKEKKGC